MGGISDDDHRVAVPRRVDRHVVHRERGKLVGGSVDDLARRARTSAKSSSRRIFHSSAETAPDARASCRHPTPCWRTSRRRPDRDGGAKDPRRPKIMWKVCGVGCNVASRARPPRLS